MGAFAAARVEAGRSSYKPSQTAGGTLQAALDVWRDSAGATSLPKPKQQLLPGDVTGANADISAYSRQPQLPRDLMLLGEGERSWWEGGGGPAAAR